MTHFDLLIIGTGSGNSILTPEFEDWKVAIVERGRFGGTCLNVGCIPSKMFVIPADRVVEARDANMRLGVDVQVGTARWSQIRDRVFGRIDPIVESGTAYRKGQSHVTVFEGDARFVSDRRLSIALADGSNIELSADRVVLAAGARPDLPPIAGLADTPFHTSDTVMRLAEAPEHLVIVGGGFIAAELGHVFAAMGTRVTVVHRGATMLRHEDTEVSQRFTECFSDLVDLRLSSTARRVSYSDGRFVVDLESKVDGAMEATSVTSDQLLVATGRIPNGSQLNVEASGVELDDDGYVITDSYMRTTAADVWALGDIRNPLQLKHLANRDARVVSHNLLNPDSLISADESVVPHAVFSHPQVGSVGATEAELSSSGVRYLVGSCDYGGVAYGWALENTTGFAKILIDPANLKVLGAHFVGPQAATLVQQMVQAMTFDLPVDRLAREQIWCHPALPEVIENALLDALKRGSTS